MGISRLTAMEIQTNEVKIVSSKPYPNGKYGGAIFMIRDGTIHKIMVSVDYGYYETEEKAIDGLQAAVDAIRNMTTKEIFAD